MIDINDIKTLIIKEKLNIAIEKLNELIKLEPKNIETRFLLAVALEKNKNYSQSIIEYKNINKLKEGYLIYNRIASIYIKLEKYNLAITNYKKSLKINDNIPETHNNYGLLLVLTNKERESIYHFKKAIELNKNYMDPIYNFLEINEKTNNLENLSNYVNKLIEIHPKNNIFRFYRSVIAENNKLHNKAKDELIKICFTETEKKWEVRKLNLLGVIYNKMNDFQNAFIYFEKTNNFITKHFFTKEFDKEKYLKKISKYLQIANDETYNHTLKNNDFNEIKSLVFLVGFPRSGTTLLDNILNNHKKIQVIEERPMLFNSLKHLSISEQINISNNNIKSVRQKYLKELSPNILKKSSLINMTIVDKMPLNFIYTRNIYKIFPNAKIIFCLRHPLDCILSCYSQNFKLNDAMISFLNLKQTSLLYDKSFELFNKYKEIPINFIHFIKYEDLVDSLDYEIKKINKFLDLDFDKDVSNFYLKIRSKERIRTASYNQVIKPIYTGSKYKWKNYKHQLKDIIPNINKWIKFYKY